MIPSRSGEFPPTVWLFPITGFGLQVTGDESLPPEVRDTGARYGYCYQPHTYANVRNGMVSPTSFSEHGYDAATQPCDLVNKFGWHPYFATREEAVQWLQDRKLDGQVQRYAHHRALSDRGPRREYQPIVQESLWEQYQPTWTSGVTDHVTTEEDRTFATPLGIAGGFTLHQPDGTTKHVGGSPEILDGIFEACEQEEAEEGGIWNVRQKP